jgi:hypothetical protein
VGTGRDITATGENENADPENVTMMNVRYRG